MKESQIHQAFSHFLDSRGVPYVHSNTHRRSSTAVGDPDYVIGWMGRILFVEIKVPGNKLSPAQEQRIAFIRAAGCRCEVAYNLEECVAAAESILCDHGQPGEPDECVCAETSARNCPVHSQMYSHLDCVGGEAGKASVETVQPKTAGAGVLPSKNQFTIARIFGTDWVGAKDLSGVWCRIRVATAADIINLPKART